MYKLIYAAAILSTMITSVSAQENISRLITNPTARHYTDEVQNCNRELVRDFNDIADGRNAAADIRQSIECYTKIAYEIIEKYFADNSDQRKSDFSRLTPNNLENANPQTLSATRATVENEVLNYISHIPAQ